MSGRRHRIRMPVAEEAERLVERRVKITLRRLDDGRFTTGGGFARPVDSPKITLVKSHPYPAHSGIIHPCVQRLARSRAVLHLHGGRYPGVVVVGKKGLATRQQNGCASNGSETP